MTVYAMFVQFDTENSPPGSTEGWRFEGLTTDEEMASEFEDNVQVDIDAAHEGAATSSGVNTIGYAVVVVSE